MAWILLPAVPLLLFAAALWAVYRIAFYSDPRGRREKPYELPDGEQYRRRRDEMLSMIRDYEEFPCEEVWITASDGLRLHGRYYHAADGAPLEMEFHGYRGSALRDFCGGSRIARARGRNVLLVDERAHGQSEGHVISFGIRERYDCLDWVRWGVARFGPDVRIVLAGVSMGAATVLMSAGLELPPNVRGIVADSPYASPAAIIRKVADDWHLPGRCMGRMAVWAARLFGGFDLEEADAVRSVQNAGVPILILHGEEDRFVPCSMSGEIAAAAPGRVRRVTFPGAGHGLSYLEDRVRYTEEVCAFTDKVL